MCGETSGGGSREGRQRHQERSGGRRTDGLLLGQHFFLDGLVRCRPRRRVLAAPALPPGILRQKSSFFAVSPDKKHVVWCWNEMKLIPTPSNVACLGVEPRVGALSALCWTNSFPAGIVQISDHAYLWAACVNQNRIIAAVFQHAFWPLWRVSPGFVMPGNGAYAPRPIRHQ